MSAAQITPAKREKYTMTYEKAMSSEWLNLVILNFEPGERANETKRIKEACEERKKDFPGQHVSASLYHDYVIRFTDLLSSLS